MDIANTGECGFDRTTTLDAKNSKLLNPCVAAPAVTEPNVKGPRRRARGISAMTIERVLRSVMNSGLLVCEVQVSSDQVRVVTASPGVLDQASASANDADIALNNWQARKSVARAS